jgi:Inorganic Pyrophosphatase
MSRVLDRIEAEERGTAPSPTATEDPGTRRSAGAAGGPDTFDTASPEARARVQEAFDASGYNEHSIEDRIEAMHPEETLGEVNEDMSGHMSGLQSSPGQQRTEIANALRERNKGYPDRATGYLDDAFGKGINVKAWEDEIKRRRKEASDPVWDAFQSTRITPTPEIEALMPRLRAAGALQAANRALTMEGKPLTRGFPELVEEVGGNAARAPTEQQHVPTAEAFQYAKEHLDDKIGAAIRAGENNEARRLTTLKQDLVDAIDNHPDPAVAGKWKAARDVWAGPTGIIKAKDFGRQVLTNKVSPEELAARWGEMSSANKNGVRIGLRDSLGDMEGAKGTPGRRMANIESAVLSPDNEAKIRTMLGPDKADRLVRSFDDEKRMRQAVPDIIGNSRTAPRLNYKQFWNPEQPNMIERAGQALDIATSPVRSGTRALLSHIGNRLDETAAARNQRIAEEAGRILTTTGPERDEILRKLARNTQGGPGGLANSEIGRQPLVPEVLERGRSGRPIRRAPLPSPAAEQGILEAGHARATGQEAFNRAYHSWVGNVLQSEMLPSKDLQDAYALGQKQKAARAEWSRDTSPTGDFHRDWAYGHIPGLSSAEFDRLVDMENGDPVGRSFYESGRLGLEQPVWTRGSRFGELPKEGVSRNHQSNEPEFGVSMAAAEHPDFKDYIWADMGGNRKRPVSHYEGWLLPFKGSDDEPLMVGLRNISGFARGPMEGRTARPTMTWPRKMGEDVNRAILEEGAKRAQAGPSDENPPPLRQAIARKNQISASPEIAAIADRLTQTLRKDTANFPAALDELRKADKDHVLAIAKEFMGQSYPSANKAIQAMQRRYDTLQSHTRKARFTAGRSAFARGGAITPPLSTRKQSNYSPTRGKPDHHCGPTKDWPDGFCAMFRKPHRCTAVAGFIAARGGCDWYKRSGEDEDSLDGAEEQERLHRDSGGAVGFQAYNILGQTPWEPVSGQLSSTLGSAASTQANQASAPAATLQSATTAAGAAVPQPMQTKAAGGRVEPTEAQKKAGKYAKRHIRVQGLDISVENEKGSERSGKDKNGKAWSVKMSSAYGYLLRTEGADGDHVDVYLGPHLKSPRVYVVNQRDADSGRFDEHKAFIGFGSETQARLCYLRSFGDGKGRHRLGPIVEMTIQEFKEWLREGDTSEPVKQAA